MNYADIKKHLKETFLHFFWANNLDLKGENCWCPINKAFEYGREIEEEKR